MNVKISYKHLEHSPALDLKINEKSERITKYLHGSYHVDWVCWTDENEHWAELKVHSDQGDFFAKASTDSMYKTLDKVIHKIERQLDKEKDQRNKIHNKPGAKVYTDSEVVTEVEEEF